MHRSPLAWLRLLLAAVLGAFLLGGPLHAAETAATRSPAWARCPTHRASRCCNACR